LAGFDHCHDAHNRLLDRAKTSKYAVDILTYENPLLAHPSFAPWKPYP
jgi:hypothetical protein